jgi:diguanylate cyclase (GGDEF)-like protein/PAS domain S-box-containing protein
MNPATTIRLKDAIRSRITHSPMRHLILSFVFVPMYLFFNFPQVLLISRLGTTAWYPALGLAMALMLGVSPWYGILVCFSDPLAGWLIYHQPVLHWSETLGAVTFATSYATAALILRGPLQIDVQLSRRRDVVRYVSVTMVAAAVSTLFGVMCLALDHIIGPGEVRSCALRWFFGDAVGLLGIAPFFLVHVLPLARNLMASAPSNRKTESGFEIFNMGANAELLCQAAALVAVLWAMFGLNDARYGQFYTCFIPIIWIALRQGIRRVVTGVLIFNFGVVLVARLFSASADIHSKLGLFMLIISATGLIVGSEVSERERAVADLSKQTDYLDSLIQNSPLGIVVLDQQGRVELANPAFEALSLYDQNELHSADIDRLLSSNESPKDEKGADIIPRVFAGEALRVQAPWRRKDGTIIQVRINAVPLMLKGRVQGAYEICQDISDDVNATAAREKHAAFLDRLVKQLQRRTSEMGLLNEMRDWLENCETESEAGLVVAESAPRLFPECLSGTLYLFKSERELAEASVSWGKSSLSEPIFAAEKCWALRRGRAHWDEPGAAAIRCSHLKPTNSSCLCLPLTVQGTTQGVLHLEFPYETASHGESDAQGLRACRERLAISVAGHIATYLSSLRLRETLREQSVRDPLTGLFNRRFMEESLDAELHRARRNREPVSVLLLDLDHFKRFNDTFGHDAGDLVLRSAADLFRGFFRRGDICCRYGGEEFAVILPRSSSPFAAVQANALRTELKRLLLHYEGQTLEPVTFSAGIATFPEHGRTAASLLSVADKCLYESKSQGRDMVNTPLLGMATLGAAAQPDASRVTQ